jgi:hypothetical protein
MLIQLLNYFNNCWLFEHFNLAIIESVRWKREHFRLSAIWHVSFSNGLNYKCIYLDVTVNVAHRKLFTCKYKNTYYISIYIQVVSVFCLYS